MRLVPRLSADSTDYPDFFELLKREISKRKICEIRVICG